MRRNLLIVITAAVTIVFIEFLVWFLFVNKNIVIYLNGKKIENLDTKKLLDK